MKKTMSVSTLSSLLLIGSLVLSGCTTAPRQSQKEPPSPQQTVVEIKTPEEIKENAVADESLFTLSDDEIAMQIQIAYNEGDWARFIQFNQQMWERTKGSSQALIEQQVWDVFKQMSHPEIQRLRYELQYHPAKSVQQWYKLISVMRGPASELEAGLQRLEAEEPDAMYSKHLLLGLKGYFIRAQKAQHVAVMLPFDSKYQQISQQIRNGILKAYFASDQSTKLSFYDSSNIDSIENQYVQAKLEGADYIIGPLRKEAAEKLKQFEDPDILALNEVDSAPFTQFSYKGSNQVHQMVSEFVQKGYQYIGILTNDNRTDLKVAHELQQAWQTLPEHIATLHIYPDQNPKLRDALGELINEKSSKDRFSNVRRFTEETPVFFPRTRQDLDAIVIVDNNRRVAVFQPQLAFFQLNAPVYGALQVSPKKLQAIQPNRDLKGVQFLTHPATLAPENLSSNFEAFGWDSFQLTRHLNAMRIGGYLRTGKTGELTLNNQRISQHLVWAKYNHKGVIEAWNPLLAHTQNLQKENTEEVSNEQPIVVKIQNVVKPQQADNPARLPAEGTGTEPKRLSY